MDDNTIFQRLDEAERAFAPQQLPLEEQERVLADEGTRRTSADSATTTDPLDSTTDEGSPAPKTGLIHEIRAGQGFGQL